MTLMQWVMFSLFYASFGAAFFVIGYQMGRLRTLKKYFGLQAECGMGSQQAKAKPRDDLFVSEPDRKLWQDPPA